MPGACGADGAGAGQVRERLRFCWDALTVYRGVMSLPHHPPPDLSTERLVLRQPGPSDTGAVVAIANDEEIARNLARMPYPYRLGDFRYFLDQVVAGEWVWLIQSRETGEAIGMIGLTPDDVPTSLILGYWLGRAHWGQGFATEAAGAVNGFARDTLACTRIRAGHFTHNPASGQVLEKLGFVVTGQSVQYSLGARAQQDHVDMALDLETP